MECSGASLVADQSRNWPMRSWKRPILLLGGALTEMPIRKDNMREITVQKDKLIKIMQKNRDEHRGVFLEAQKAYRTAVVKALDEQLKLAQEGHPFNLFTLTAITAPSDHTVEYDRIIGMMKLDTAKTVKLSDTEYRCYVDDDWGWMHNFANVVSSYGVSNAKLARYTTAKPPEE